MLSYVYTESLIYSRRKCYISIRFHRKITLLKIDIYFAISTMCHKRFVCYIFNINH